MFIIFLYTAVLSCLTFGVIKEVFNNRGFKSVLGTLDSISINEVEGLQASLKQYKFELSYHFIVDNNTYVGSFLDKHGVNVLTESEKNKFIKKNKTVTKSGGYITIFYSEEDPSNNYIKPIDIIYQYLFGLMIAFGWVMLIYLIGHN